ncbi:alpha/beta hydrolase family protein [Sphingomonas desiccabilis]|uniref:Alpha/beta hydrolase n=1 Tax=Sphingomonas desiccabilis TaxID=429134 RepID=A0A4Q2IV83_9SPHN|nr:alpha/beta hydrolase [Sphingomonas desiccabilis]MBB3909627.1 pimeloyl-ACP methyl ester carboxylesterase [Sphingomonas desiccabilis]RXZ34336.1 alpha/beta hydrolase [Sphingomonas desiccabilis]
MTDASPAERPLAFHHTPGKGPTIVFLPGYASDMTGSKALAIEAWAKAEGRAFVRFDYGGCGQSPGAFEEQTLTLWRDDALAIIDYAVEGPVVLVGSSMGGWIMLLAAGDRPERVVGLVGIAPAPDFTDWGFTPEEKMTMLTQGRLEKPSPYSEQPTVTTRAFWSSGEANRLMHGTIPIDLPVRLIQGQADTDVPYARTLYLAGLLRSADVQTLLVKDGDHRLSRPQDIALILRAIEDLIPA